MCYLNQRINKTSFSPVLIGSNFTKINDAEFHEKNECLDFQG